MSIELRLVAANGQEVLNGVLPDAFGKTVSPVYCDYGVVNFSYPVNGRNFDKIRGLKRFEVAVYIDGVKQPRLGATVMTSDGDDVDEAGSVKYEGQMLLQLLDGMVVFPNGWPNYDPLNPQKKLVNATAGTIIKTFVAESQARGARTEITTSSFNGSTDSNGVAWSKQISLEINPGVKITDVLKSLHGNYMCEFEMVGRDLRLYQMDTLSADRTLGSAPVVFRRGRDVTDSPRKVNAREIVTAMLAGGKDSSGVYHEEVDAAALAEFGRIEGFVSNGNITDRGTLEAFSEAEIQQVSQARMEKTHGLTFENDKSPKPTRDFNVGDWTFSDTGSGLERYRVKQWVLKEDSDGTMSGSVVLNDLFAEVTERLVRRVNGIIGGTTVTGASKAEDRVPADLTDGVAPKIPVGLAISSSAYTQSSGQSWAQITATWQQVTQNVDGTILEDLDHYDIRWRPQTGSGGTRAPVTYDYAQENNATYNANWDKLLAEGWRGVPGDNVERIYPPEYFDGSWRVVPAGDASTISWSPVQPGIPVQVQVRSVDRIGNTAGWSTTVAIMTATDATAPPVPAAPVMDNYLGLIRIIVSGEFVNNVRAPGDFDVFRLHTSEVADFTPTPANRVENFTLAGGSHFIKAPYGETRYAKLVAVDYNGNESAASAQASSAATKLLGDDIFAGAVGSAALATAAVKRANIDDLAVNSAKISDLDVGKLTAGILSAQMTLTGRLATALTGQRMELNGLGLYGYTASETLSIRLDGINNLLAGTFMTALTGRRISMTAGGTSGQALFFAPDGRVGRLISFTEGTGLEAIRLEAPRPQNEIAKSYINMNSDNYTQHQARIHEFVTTPGSGPEQRFVYFINDGTAARTRFLVTPDVLVQYGSNNTERIRSGDTFKWTHPVGSGAFGFEMDSTAWFHINRGNSNGRFEFRTNNQGSAIGGTFCLFAPNGYGVGIRVAADSSAQQIDVVNPDSNVWYSIRASQFLAQSDEASKTDIHPVATGDMLVDVLNMPVKRYHRMNSIDEDGNPCRNMREEIGFIAQNTPPRVSYVSSGTQFVDQYQTLALAVGAIQELKKLNDAQQKELDAMKGKFLTIGIKL